MRRYAGAVSSRSRRAVSRVGAGCLVLAMCGPLLAQTSERRSAVVNAIRKVQPSVVSISSEKRAASNVRWPFSAEESQRPRVSGMGTGVVIDERGYVMTNQHVVDRVSGVEVILADGSSYPAVVVQQDPAMDIAILKVEAGKPLIPISIGSSADLMEGETVITIGNAFGYENTKSVGIISALGRNVTLSDDQVYRNLIQTDACINPGNSGGPLVNIDGELIGINVAVRAGAQGIGFALPIDDVKKVVVEMISTRRLASTWHGIVANETIQNETHEVVLADVQAGSPAESAGFQRGDRVVKVGVINVRTAIDVERGFLGIKPGERVDVQIQRGGKDQVLALEMQAVNRPAATAAAPTETQPDGVLDQIWQKLGVRLVPVPRDYVRAVSSSFRGGLYVQAVMPGSPAARASIQKGDILVGMNAGSRNWETIRPDNILFVLKQPDVQRAQALQYYLVRRNEFVQGLISFAESASVGLRR